MQQPWSLTGVGVEVIRGGMGGWLVVVLGKEGLKLLSRCAAETRSKGMSCTTTQVFVHIWAWSMRCKSCPPTSRSPPRTPEAGLA